MERRFTDTKKRELLVEAQHVLAKLKEMTTSHSDHDPHIFTNLLNKCRDIADSTGVEARTRTGALGFVSDVFVSVPVWFMTEERNNQIGYMVLLINALETELDQPLLLTTPLQNAGVNPSETV